MRPRTGARNWLTPHDPPKPLGPESARYKLWRGFGSAANAHPLRPNTASGQPTANHWEYTRLFLRSQPQRFSQDSHNRSRGRVPASRGVILKLGNHGGNTLGGQAECAAWVCRFEVAKEFPSPLGVSGYASWSAFADFHAGGSKVNEPLDETGLGCCPAKGVPEAFPGFVRLPYVAVIEQVDRVTPFGACGEQSGKGTAPGRGLSWQARELTGGDRRLAGAIFQGNLEMPSRIVCRVRKALARNIAIGRQFDGRGVTRRRSGRHGSEGLLMSADNGRAC